MPKINVYLPDELAESVKAAGVPVSAICQRALEQSVKRVTAIRAAVLNDLESVELPHFTDRARTVIQIAINEARNDGAAEVGTAHLLYGVLTENGNLALQVLRAMDIELSHVARVLAEATLSERGDATRFSSTAANALELTVVEAMSLGHNYVGCEHMLLGLLGEPDGTGGNVLREVGVDLKAARRTVVAALTGYAHLRAQVQQNDPAAMIAALVKKEIQPLVERVERLERA